jgi:hypothetical protein
MFSLPERGSMARFAVAHIRLRETAFTTGCYMDDNDAKNTGGKFRMIPIFEKAVTLAAATPGLKLMLGSGAEGSTYAHGARRHSISKSS